MGLCSIFKYLINTIIVLLMCGFIINQIYLHEESHDKVGLGELFRLSDGRNLNYWCEGEPSKPTILCLHGAFDNMMRFWDIVQDLKKDYRVCAWDRAGRGFSDASINPNTALVALNDTEELINYLLSTKQISLPYVMIGHSLGGLVSVAHSQKHQNDVKGLVLYDPPPIVEDLENDELFKKLTVVWNVSFRTMIFASASGLMRLMFAVSGTDGYWTATLSQAERVQRLQARHLSCPSYFAAALADCSKVAHMTRIVHRGHLAALDPAVLQRRKLATHVLRLTSDFRDVHDVPWANITQAEILDYLEGVDAPLKFRDLVEPPAEHRVIHLPDSTHVFLSLQPAETLRHTRDFLKFLKHF